MAEEWGKIIIKANDEITQTFNVNYCTGLVQLADFSKVNVRQLENSLGNIDKVELKAGYVILSYDCSDWLEMSKLFVTSAINIEYYAKHGDEYGTLSFFALSADGSRLALEYDDEGDLMEDEDYKEEITVKLKQWMHLIPEEIKQYIE